jgi:hypothetical protein
MAEGEKRIDTFVGSLIIIAIILIALLAASYYYPYYPSTGPGGGPGTGGNVVYSFTAGTIGFSENYVSRTQNLGSFGVGVSQKELLRSAPKLEITAGLFGSSSEKFDITIPDNVLEFVKGGEITFTVDDTNQYGNLIMKWNGAEVLSKRPGKGKQNVTLDASQMKAENSLEIAAQGPGLLFWAATVYELSDFKVSAEYGPAKFADFTVSQDELESLNRFELGWVTASKKGMLLVNVNGDQVYNGTPDRQQKVEFTESALQTASIGAGTNRLTFIAINGSFELQDVSLKTYVSKNQRTMKERFDVSKTQLDFLKARGGVVRVYVKSVDKSGELRIKLNEASAGSVQAKAGWNNIGFNGNLAVSGTNWLELGGTGTFDVSDVSVEVA